MKKIGLRGMIPAKPYLCLRLEGRSRMVNQDGLELPVPPVPSEVEGSEVEGSEVEGSDEAEGFILPL